jgi:hypothetical protein
MPGQGIRHAIELVGLGFAVVEPEVHFCFGIEDLSKEETATMHVLLGRLGAINNPAVLMDIL